MHFQKPKYRVSGTRWVTNQNRYKTSTIVVSRKLYWCCSNNIILSKKRWNQFYLKHAFLFNILSFITYSHLILIWTGLYVLINTSNGNLFIYHIFLVVYNHYAITYLYIDCNNNQDNNTIISNFHKLRDYPHSGFPKSIFPSGTVWCLWSLNVLRELELQYRKPLTCKTPCQGRGRDGQIRFRYRCPVIYISWYIISYWIFISLKYLRANKLS